MSLGYGFRLTYGFSGDIGSVTPPDTSDIVYNLTEELRTDTGYEYVTDSIGDDTNGYLEESNGDAYNPNIAQYPLDGTIDLSSGQVINTIKLLTREQLLMMLNKHSYTLMQYQAVHSAF